MVLAVEDKRLLSTDGSGTVLQSTGGSGTVMSTESCLRGNRQMQNIRKFHGKKFEEIYSGFVNGIRTNRLERREPPVPLIQPMRVNGLR